MKCDCCNGTGLVSILQNPECHFDGLETPEYVEEGCEECGGSGEVSDVSDELYCENCGSPDTVSDEEKVHCNNCGHTEQKTDA